MIEEYLVLRYVGMDEVRIFETACHIKGMAKFEVEHWGVAGADRLDHVLDGDQFAAMSGW